MGRKAFTVYKFNRHTQGVANCEPQQGGLYFVFDLLCILMFHVHSFLQMCCLLKAALFSRLCL